MKTLRCAIYTRKSSEEGLDQAFNSLHAQREACEAYIKSQAGEGWRLIKTAYDDGGFSGGNTERPGLRALLRAVDEGLVDVVVVYKVDRLTRSLGDFARIVDRFDAKGVSFVSVTQAFNTTTSMGRLTLNVLLSFAQFEREVTGERIRDKIAASKAKGMWMGGNPPLGYDPPTDLTTRALVVNPVEAAVVRQIFDRYLEQQSVHELKRWLDKQGIGSKAWTSSRGVRRGGVPFSRGALFHLLKNRLYLGQIVHRDAVHPGAHPAIVDKEVFDRVQDSLEGRATQHKERPTRVAEALLKGRVFDGAGEPMSPAFTYGKSGRVHRYYVLASLQQGRRADGDDDSVRRAPAAALEALVMATGQKLGATPPIDGLARVELHPASVQMVWERASLLGGAGDARAQLDLLMAKLQPYDRITLEGDGRAMRLTLPYRFQVRGGRSWMVGPTGEAIRRGPSSADATLVKGLRSAHALMTAHSPSADGQDFTLSSVPKSGYERALMRIAFLAPDIQQAILQGRQPAALSLEDLIHGEIPAGWVQQRRAFGFAPAN